VGSLHLASAEVFLKRQIQTDEAESRSDGSRSADGVLRGISVHRVLMNEFAPAVRQSIGRQFVTRFCAIGSASRANRYVAGLYATQSISTRMSLTNWHTTVVRAGRVSPKNVA